VSLPSCRPDLPACLSKCKWRRLTLHPDNIKTYNDQLLAVNRLRDGYVKMKDGVATYMPGLNEMVQATGMMTVETVKSLSATQSFTKALTDHKVGLGSVITDGAVQGSATRCHSGAGESTKGRPLSSGRTAGLEKNAIDLYVPKNIGNALVDAHTKYGMINYAIQQIATNTVNWGKNTQWAGRQLTAGISMPLGICRCPACSLG
jgi:hypothetical protein